MKQIEQQNIIATRYLRAVNLKTLGFKLDAVYLISVKVLNFAIEGQW